MSFKQRLLKVEAALIGGPEKCICRDVKPIIWHEWTDTEEEFEATLERARQRPKCPLHRRQPPIPSVRVTRWWPNDAAASAGG